MRHASPRIRALLAVVAGGALATTASLASADPLGLYIGAGAGEAQVKVDSANFSESHAGWKALVGLRPISMFGAELEYVDFGHPTASPFNVPMDARVRGAALSALLYAPLPVPTFDLYAKAGFGRLQSTGTTIRPGVGTCVIDNPTCALFRFDRTDTRFAFGVGAQVKVSSFAIRAEYQRFSSDLGNPTFWSAALTWSF